MRIRYRIYLRPIWFVHIHLYLVSVMRHVKPEVPTTSPVAETPLEGPEEVNTSDPDQIKDTLAGVTGESGKEGGTSLTGDQPADNITEIGVSLTENLLTDNAGEPVAGTSRCSSSRTSGSTRPVRYRSVAREVGTGPEGEILMRNVLEAIGESEASEGEADQRIGQKYRSNERLALKVQLSVGIPYLRSLHFSI